MGGGWSTWNSTCQNGWRESGWRMRNDVSGPAGVSRTGGRWTGLDVGVTILTFWANWHLGLAFLALKLWHQASAHPGSTFSFAREKWEGLVGATRSVMGGAHLPFANPFAMKSSGNHAFDTWREAELARIDAERDRLRASEREFAAYRDELMHAKDREDFDRFMQSRGAQRGA